MMVAIYHFINWKYDNAMGAKLASLVFNGSDAVSYFFVLSGFVLSYKYIVLGDGLDIRKFYVNRVFRIWPAFFITILSNAIYSNRHSLGMHNLADIFIRNNQQFWEEALLFRGHNNQYVPGWTLYIELTLSFFIPFMILFARKDKRVIYWFIFAILLMGGAFIFVFHFALGVLISCLYRSITDESFKKTWWHKNRYVLFIAAFVLFSIRHIDRISALGPSYKYIADYLNINFFHYTALASFVFIILILQSDKLKNILSHSWFRLLGKVSYGIYLMHWLLVRIVMDNWDTLSARLHSVKYMFIIVLPCYLIATVLLAVIVHYAIEIPFIRIGKRFTNRLKPSFQF